MIAGAIAFIRSPLGVYLLIGLAAVALMFTVNKCGYDNGVEHQRAEYAKALEAARKAVVKREAKAETITGAVKADVVQRQIEYRTITKTLIRKVPEYVSIQADDRCVVPAGFVGLHDSAAAGSPSLPIAPGGSLDAPSGVELSAVAETLVGNYGIAHQWRAEALGWRTWYAQQKAAWDKP